MVSISVAKEIALNRSGFVGGWPCAREEPVERPPSAQTSIGLETRLRLRADVPDVWLSLLDQHSLSRTVAIGSRLHGPLDSLHGALEGFGLATVGPISPFDQLTAPADRPLEVSLRLGQW